MSDFTLSHIESVSSAWASIKERLETRREEYRRQLEDQNNSLSTEKTIRLRGRIDMIREILNAEISLENNPAEVVDPER